MVRGRCSKKHFCLSQLACWLHVALFCAPAPTPNEAVYLKMNETNMTDNRDVIVFHLADQWPEIWVADFEFG
jgi:hypothetical protein